MGGKGKAPAAPDLSEMVNATREAAAMWQAHAKDELKWAKEQNAQNQAILERVLGVQLPMMEEQFRQAVADRERYEGIYQPLEDNLVREFEQYDSPERREQEAATAIADVRQSFEAQRANAEAALESYGIDPGQLRGQSLDRGIRAQEAAMSAFAGNQGRKSVEQMGRALRGEAINIGRGYPGQVAQTQSMMNQTGAGALQGGWGNTQAGAMASQGALAAGGMAMQGHQQGADISTQGFQNSLNQWNANAAASQAGWNTAANVAGSAMGMFSFSDPALKENRTAPRRSAAKAIAATPAEEYDYRGDTGLDDGQRHVGPMADEVRQNLGIGNGTAIPMQDLVMAQHAAIGELEQRLSAMEGGGGGGVAIPADVLAYKGLEHFEKLINKVRGNGAGNQRGAA